jgi:uncharacterized YigZ family protein
MTNHIDTYLTIDHSAEGLYKEKGSKFIAFAFRVESEDDIKEHLLQLRKEHHKARHHCYAWKLGMDDNNWRANDDGEPNNSAGNPIYGQILSKGLTNVLIVVVRYFGGTKLGVGGLITAYKSAAEDALSQANIIEKQLMTHYLVQFNYPSMNEVMSFLKQLDVQLYDQDFALACSLKVAIAFGQSSTMDENLNKIEGVKTTLLFVR